LLAGAGLYEAIVGLIMIVELAGMNAGSSNSPIVASVRNLRVFGILMIFVEMLRLSYLSWEKKFAALLLGLRGPCHLLSQGVDAEVVGLLILSSEIFSTTNRHGL
jgi:hypothetical protein